MFLLAAVVVLAGCGGSRAAERESAPALPDRSAAAREMLAAAFQPRKPAPLPSGFRMRRVSEGRFALALPREWLALTRLGVTHPGVAKTLARAHRPVAPFLAALSMPDSPLKLVAFERLRAQTSLSVLVTAVEPGLPYERWSRLLAEQTAAQASFVPPLRETRVPLPAGDALRLDYRRRTGGRVLATVQYLVVRGDRAFILVFATPPREKTQHVAVFERVARSLDLD